MPLDVQYLRFCQPGNPFYAPVVASETSAGFDVSDHASAGWTSKIAYPWVNWLPAAWKFPRQGWKIHVSATPENAESVLLIAAQACFDSGLAFKHLASARELLSQNGKYADRSAAGKFITVYPGSDEQFVGALETLDHLLAGYDGPYILSDRRWRSGPVYFRYGAFVPPSDDSSFTSTLIDPQGNEVEDPRRPSYTPPTWATLPDAVAGARDEEDVDFPFTMISALHFSNGGGVYLAEATTDDYVAAGTRVVLKEARPHAGLDVDGTDAVTRLGHEAEVLQELQGLDCVPAYYGTFAAWEHHFIILEHVQGQDLKREWMKRTPVLRPAPWDLRQDAYIAWLSSTIDSLNEALDSVHSLGWLLGDIHPKNVIMRDGTRPCFIDFEFAHRMDSSWRCQQGAPGYEPFFGLTGTAADRWSMAILELDLIYPQATIADQGNVWKIEQLLNAGTRSLAIPESIGRSVRRATVDILPASRGDELYGRVRHIEGLTDAGLREGITAGLLTLVDWGTDGPLAPGDIALFASDGAENQAGYPYGAAGIIDQLRRSSAWTGRSFADDWLASRANYISSPGLRGWEGVAYVAREADLCRTLDAVGSRPQPNLSDPTLWSGWAGVGLYDLESGNDPTVAAHHLERLLDTGAQGETVGLLNGWCAAAIFFARLHEQTGEGRYVSLATQAIEADLARCITTTNGTLEFDEGWRTLPYLGVGSLGVGLAILELQRVTDTPVFSKSLSEIDAAATYHQCGQASLAHGLAGFLIYLQRRVRHRPSEMLEQVISSHLQSLRLHAVLDNTSVFFRGNQNLRLSSDYLTGASGVLGALNEVLDGSSSLPFGI